MITAVRAAPAFLLSLALFVAACSRTHPGADVAYPARVRFGEGSAVLRVDVARSDAERRRGLMHVRSLPEDGGMAFVWTAPTDTGFWMKDTLVPLSVAFVDRDGRVVTIRDMTPCASDPCPVYSADAPFVLAVEANRGWFAEHGVAVGDRAVLDTP
jgi:uncharacterized membrane protein (UPF0127 family)